MTEDAFLINPEQIPTYNKKNKENGCVFPLVNTAIPNVCPIELVYITTCASMMVKGPHVHSPPKIDKFVCVSGECLVVTRNEETGKVQSFFLNDTCFSLIVIPPGNSHLITSCGGCTVLSICSEKYYPGHYNQEETKLDGEMKKAVKKYLLI